MKDAPAASIDAYLAQYDGVVRGHLDALRATIRAAAPDATERMTYRMPTFHQRKNLVHFAAYAHHIGFYPGPEAIVAFADELAQYPSSKGAIRFPLDAPMPLDLVRRITEHRVRAVS